jgi:hypothetical protein
MAAKHATKRRLPPMFARVVVADALAAAEARARFFAAMQGLVASGVLDVVMRLVRLERGVWLREGHRWPTAIRRTAKQAFASADALNELASACSVVTDEGLPEQVRRAMEPQALGLLQRLMDHVYEADRPGRPAPADALAGLSGSAPALAALHAASGVEAAAHLAFCVRRAVLGLVESPFWPYVVSAQAWRRMRKQVGREQPKAVSDLEPPRQLLLRDAVDLVLVANLCPLGHPEHSWPSWLRPVVWKPDRGWKGRFAPYAAPGRGSLFRLPRGPFSCCRCQGWPRDAGRTHLEAVAAGSVVGASVAPPVSA